MKSFFEKKQDIKKDIPPVKQAQKNKFETPNVNVEINKTMNVDGTKVEAFDIVVNFGKEYSTEQKVINENAAQTCPVGNSLGTDIKRSNQFNY